MVDAITIYMTTTKYQNAAGNEVTMHQTKAGYIATIVQGQITLYNPNGDMMCGAKDEQSAINLINEWSME